MSTDFGTAPPAAPGSGKTNGLAIGSLVCGILALPICCVPYGAYVSLILAIAAIVLGVMAKKQIDVTREQGRGLATAGIIIGAVMLALTIIMLILAAMGAAFGQAFLQQLQQQQQGIEQPGADGGMGLEEDADSDLGASGDAAPADGEAMEDETETAPEPAEQ